MGYIRGNYPPLWVKSQVDRTKTLWFLVKAGQVLSIFRSSHNRANMDDGLVLTAYISPVLLGVVFILSVTLGDMMTTSLPPFVRSFKSQKSSPSRLPGKPDTLWLLLHCTCHCSLAILAPNFWASVASAPSDCNALYWVDSFLFWLERTSPVVNLPSGLFDAQLWS